MDTDTPAHPATEQSATHTPGPWRATWTPDRGHHLLSDSGALVMFLWGTRISDANTRLMAAAPSLLAALKAVDARYRELLARQPHFPDYADEKVLDLVRAALARAEGQ